jgi:mannose-1-phosphate guanylyltransferase
VITTAFVLGAGLGTRLKTLTLHRPKPLIPVCNRPLITYAFDHLLGIGVQRFIVNTHHRAEAYDAEFPKRTYRGAPVELRHEPDILETAGGIKNVDDLLGNEPFIVYNGDILSDLPLDDVLRIHRERGDEVTMVLRSKDGPLEVAVDAASGRVTDVGRLFEPENNMRFLFTGIYVVEPAFLERMSPATKIGVVPVFRTMIRERAALGAVIVDEGHWWDLGTRERYLAVHRHFRTAGVTDENAWIDPSAQIAPTAVIGGSTAIGAGVRIGDDAQLEDCIVWAGAEIAKGTVLRECIVTAGQQVSGTHSQTDF